MQWRGRPRIGVIGSSSCPPQVQERAHAVGCLIARAGAILICGGRGGVMEAAARGAKEAGGMTIGILPGDTDAEANPYIDIPIVTGMGMARNAVNVLSSQAIIAVAGAYGTLSEIALAGVSGVPVIGLGTWSLKDPEQQTPSALLLASTPEEAVQMALECVRRKTVPRLARDD